MATTPTRRPTDLKPLELRAQQLEDGRCTVCLARVADGDRALFESTNLCPACAGAVNESLIWRPFAEVEA